MPEKGQSIEPTVFIVDDDASVRRSMERLVRSMGFRPETFASAEEFLARERYIGVGCIILDIQMPGLSGVDLQDRLNNADYSMPIIFVTGHGDIPLGVTAMKKGAVDFLPKPVDDQDLLQAVTMAIERDRIARFEWTETREARELLKLLTPREHEVLEYVVSGMMNKQIAFKLNIAEKTVKEHRGHMMKKLHAQSVADLVRLAEKADTRLPGKGPP
jgi:FixJ family two-component response regulator